MIKRIFIVRSSQLPVPTIKEKDPKQIKGTAIQEVVTFYYTYHTRREGPRLGFALFERILGLDFGDDPISDARAI